MPRWPSSPSSIPMARGRSSDGDDAHGADPPFAPLPRARDRRRALRAPGRLCGGKRLRAGRRRRGDPGGIIGPCRPHAVPPHRLQGLEYRSLARRRRRRDGRGEQPGLCAGRRHPYCTAGAGRGARACRPQGRRSADRNPRSGLEHGRGRRLLPRGARRDELLAAAYRRARALHDGQGLRRRPQAPGLRARLPSPRPTSPASTSS